MILHDKAIWSQSFLDSVKQSVIKTRQSFIENNKGIKYVSGWRFNNDDRVVDTFLSLVLELNDRVIPNDARRLEHISLILIKELTWRALDECADSDEWYQFHKDWG